MTTAELRQALTDSVKLESGKVMLRSAKSNDELVSLWALHCEHLEGEARLDAQEEYARQVLRLGVLQG